MKRTFYVALSNIDDFKHEVLDGASFHNTLEECETFYQGVCDEEEYKTLKFFIVIIEDLDA